MRSIKQLIPAVTVSDGAGVKIKRSLGQQPQLRLDPFLMLDCFGSEQASDYIAGFPAHPHRGFETVTYMLDGHMLHEDHLGNKGHLQSGGVQWMTAGRGIIHSEMPQQESGLMRGFQLWLNLPAAEKMKDAAYVDIAPEQIPTAQLAAGISAKVIAGVREHLLALERLRLLLLCCNNLRFCYSIQHFFIKCRITGLGSSIVSSTWCIVIICCITCCITWIHS